MEKETKGNRNGKLADTAPFITSAFSVLFLYSLIEMGHIYMELYGVRLMVVNLGALVLLNFCFLYLFGYWFRSHKLERQLAELEENTPDKIPDDPTPKMLDRVSSVHDILVSDSYSLVQKNEALKQIIDKIVYDRESDTLKIHFFLYHS